MPATEREDAQTLLDAVWPVRNDFLRVDFRSYPSKSFKKGYAEQPFSALAPQLKHVLSTRVNVTQIVGEEFLEMFNTKAKNGLHALCLKSKIGWEVWRKDTTLAMRILIAHAAEKKRMYKRALRAGAVTRSHPAWMIELYGLSARHRGEEPAQDGAQEVAEGG